MYALEEYTNKKKNDNNTDEECLKVDIDFVPLVIEANSGSIEASLH